MTIESTRAPEGAKTAATGAHRASAKSGQAGATAGAPGEGFADLMSLLSAQDEGQDAVLPGSDALLTATGAAPSSELNMPLSPDKQGLEAINLISIPILLTAASVPSDATTTAAAAGELQAVALAPTLPTPGKTPANPLSDKRRPGEKADTAPATNLAASAPGRDAASEVSALLDNRPAPVASGISQMQADLREVKTALQSATPTLAPDASRLAAATASLSGVQNPPERQEAKSISSPSGRGLEGMLGGALADRLGISPTYEVAPATAVVPDTQVAETVSYWATHGVQSAELTLDGLGNEPVKVHISVEGDQAQVDFRSNQPEVRQALENASAQLKAMLSGEGLQLTGMSVGTSAQGQAPGEGRQPKPASRQTKLVSLEPASVNSARSANPAVGRALDLYV